MKHTKKRIKMRAKSKEDKQAIVKIVSYKKRAVSRLSIWK